MSLRTNPHFQQQTSKQIIKAIRQLHLPITLHHHHSRKAMAEMTRYSPKPSSMLSWPTDPMVLSRKLAAPLLRAMRNRSTYLALFSLMACSLH